MFEAISEAFDRAANGQLHVLNMSIGTTAFNSYEDALFCEMLSAYDVTSVAATGNSGGSIVFPAKSDCVVAVGGIRPDGTRNPASNYGPEIDAVAPYANYAINPSGGIELVFGTSFASPVIAGIAALQWSGSFREFHWMDIFTYHQANWNDQVGNGPPNWALYNLWDTACSVYDFNMDGEFDLSDMQNISYRYGAFFTT